MTVFDLFSGTGTIGQVLAPVAKAGDRGGDRRGGCGGGAGRTLLHERAGQLPVHCRRMYFKVLDEIDGEAGCDRAGPAAGRECTRRRCLKILDYRGGTDCLYLL